MRTHSRATSSIPSPPTAISSDRGRKCGSRNSLFPSSSSCSTVGFCSGKAWLGDLAFDGVLTGFAVYIKVVCCCCVLHFSADTAVWRQQGKAVTCERTGKRGAGAFGMVACAVQSSSSRILGQALRLFFFLFLLLCEIVPRYNEWRLCSFIPVGCIALLLSRTM